MVLSQEIPTYVRSHQEHRWLIFRNVLKLQQQVHFSSFELISQRVLNGYFFQIVCLSVLQFVF